MPVITDYATQSIQEQTSSMLRDLNLPIHRNGYIHLCAAIPSYAQDRSQGLCKEIYTYIAELQGYTDWHAVESAIRDVILDAWEKRDPDAWNEYFPCATKAPSNKVFIATLAGRLK